MAKILLVEDDNNLREIYGERLLAEGYAIVSARDGEEALSVAITEKPDLIISDVMMPKISGFDMLDILRQTPETKDVKIIMMTALSQAEDKTRADKLGADKYLVKSQVTLEDVARVVHDLLGDETGPDDATTPAMPQAATEPATVTPATPVVSAPPVTQEPVAVVIPPVAVATPPEPIIPTTQPDPQAQMPVAEPVTQPMQPDPVSPPTVQVETPQATPAIVPSTTPGPEPNSIPSTAPLDNMPPALAPVAPPANPISGDSSAPIDAAAAQAQTAQAEASQAELQEVAQQIEQFVPRSFSSHFP